MQLLGFSVCSEPVKAAGHLLPLSSKLQGTGQEQAEEQGCHCLSSQIHFVPTPNN